MPIQPTNLEDATNCLYTFTNKYYKTKTVRERSCQQSRVRRTKVTDTIIKITQDKTKHTQIRSEIRIISESLRNESVATNDLKTRLSF